MPDNLEVLEGSVSDITYYSHETGYCVIKIAPDKLVMGVQSGIVTVVGYMPEVQPGETLRFEGAWTTNPKYGKQFKAEHFTRVLPVTKDGIRRYLGSGLIKGVGPVTAERIVECFGEETLRILDAPDALERLRQVPKLGKHRAELLLSAWADQREMAAVLVFLQGYQVGTALSMKIYKYYKARELSAIQVIREDPYQLIYDIQGVGFKTADRIALNLGLPHDSPSRLRAALVYLIGEAASEGHVFHPVAQLLDKALDLLGLEEDARASLDSALDRLLREGNVRLDNVPLSYGTAPLPVAYLPSLYYSERGAARRIIELVETPDTRLEQAQQRTDHTWAQLLETAAQSLEVRLTEQQAAAIKTAMTSKLSILTGGPGTGKTTTLQTLIKLLEFDQISYRLASPTGRAAKRLSQATEREAQTIHRLLGYRFLDEFIHNEENPLNKDFIIIDEASMLDLHLFYALMRAMPFDGHLLLVGDVDQLPSVGAGDVLRDLIRSGICPVTRLDVIFRQASDSQIVRNAHRINHGEMPLLDNKSNDFFFFSEEDPLKAAELLVDIVQNRLPNKFGYDPIRDIQVLAPMYRTSIGVQALNEALQAKLNPPGRPAERRFGGQIFRVGDRVMQLRNNYDKGVFNGDMGRIHSFDMEAQQLIVEIENEHLSYSWEEADQLTLAYACSVHRSQGSEYPVIVMPILTQHYMMLQRNLLYTAITRAKKMVVLVGTRKAISIAVRNNKVARRWSALDWRLQELSK